ncbi:MAG: leucyl/phenylalanyl-tRNA--protein transferase [Rhodothermales bacterium]
MSVYWLNNHITFPPVDEADIDGLLAIGGDLSPRRLIAAYAQGIFPWYNEDPILWFSPNPRCSKTLARTLRKGQFEVRFDTSFEAVMRACGAAPRPGQDGTWITEEMITAYNELFQLGYAHSIETWEDGELVGGLYGVSLGAAFFGESMFAWRPDASKVAFASLVEQLRLWHFQFIDCQVHTPHLERFGAKMWPRAEFITALHLAVREQSRRGPWLKKQSTTDHSP